MKIIRSFRKTLSLKVDKDWELIIKSPFFVTKKSIDIFVSRNKLWIENRQKAYKQKITVSDIEIVELKKKARIYIPKRVDELTKKFWYEYNKIKITSAKSRWGSCTSKKNLNFTYRLMLAPNEVIDYVIIHEMAHLKHMNHSKIFRNEVKSMCESYKEQEKWLKEEWIKYN